MNETKISPAILRLLVIFPNVLSYMLLLGIIIYIFANYSGLLAADVLYFWIMLAVLLAPMAMYTSYSIVKRIKAGTL